MLFIFLTAGCCIIGSCVRWAVGHHSVTICPLRIPVIIWSATVVRPLRSSSFHSQDFPRTWEKVPTGRQHKVQWYLGSQVLVLRDIDSNAREKNWKRWFGGLLPDIEGNWIVILVNINNLEVVTQIIFSKDKGGMRKSMKSLPDKTSQCTETQNFSQ